MAIVTPMDEMTPARVASLQQALDEFVAIFERLRDHLAAHGDPEAAAEWQAALDRVRAAREDEQTPLWEVVEKMSALLARRLGEQAGG